MVQSDFPDDDDGNYGWSSFVAGNYQLKGFYWYFLAVDGVCGLRLFTFASCLFFQLSMNADIEVMQEVAKCCWRFLITHLCDKRGVAGLATSVE